MNLKPCPFCGGEAFVTGQPPASKYIACVNNECPVICEVLDADAEEHWNRRAPVPEERAPVNEGPLINASLNTWLATDHGDSCIDGSASGKYLQNRIEAAFIAGWDASKEALSKPRTAGDALDLLKRIQADLNVRAALKEQDAVDLSSGIWRDLCDYIDNAHRSPQKEIK